MDFIWDFLELYPVYCDVMGNGVEDFGIFEVMVRLRTEIL